MTDSTTLDGLDDETFASLLVKSVLHDHLFDPFLEVEVVDQTYDLLRSLKIEQLARRPEARKGSPAARQLGLLLTAIDRRLAQAKQEIKRLNVEENESADDKYRRIARFAFELAETLERLGEVEILDRLKIDDDCTGMQFLNNYRAKHMEGALA